MFKTAISGNISSSISDHLPQFFKLPDFFSISIPTKHKIMSYDWENFSKQLFPEDFAKENWIQILQLNQSSVNLTFDNYLNSVNSLIYIQAPLRKLSKNERKFQKVHGLPKLSRIQLIRRIDFLKYISNLITKKINSLYLNKS